MPKPPHRCTAKAKPDPATGTLRIDKFGLELYPKPGARNHWLLPVCAAHLRPRLERLSPSNAACWEDSDMDGCPTTCFRMTLKQVRFIEHGTFRTSFAKFANALGGAVVHEFFPALWLKDHNGRVMARNTWERHNGGLRYPAFNRGPSVRACARMSIT